MTRKVRNALIIALTLLMSAWAIPATGQEPADPRDGQIAGTDGRLFTVSVEIEPGLSLVGDPAAAVVFDILSDRRSWIGAGDVRFQIIDSTDADIRVRIASPSTVDQRCLPLRTVGRLSCRNGRSLNINADRWNGATEFWTTGLEVYRAYLINHEVGHYLGYGHVNCTGVGQRAPVMQQQTKSLQGCVENGWPYPDNPPGPLPYADFVDGEGPHATIDIAAFVRRIVEALRKHG